MYTYQGKRIFEGRSWVDANGVTHPSNWNKWSDATKTAKGLVWVEPAPSYDRRFYYSAGNPKDLSELKTAAISQVKSTAYSLLQPTDWYVVREHEHPNNSPIPADIQQKRDAIRKASNDIEAAINAVTDLKGFKALYDMPVDADGIPTGNAPINDWPIEEA